MAIVDILEAKDREKKMVTVDAGNMAKSIDTSGRVALYGIYFDFNKADLKPESDATLEEIAGMLKQSPSRRSWSSGTPTTSAAYAFNLDLSQRRATAVVAALTRGLASARAG